MGGSAISAGIGTAGSLLAGGKASSAAEEAAQKQQQNEVMMKVWESQRNQQLAQEANAANQQNYNAQNATNRENLGYSNTLNRDNQSWANQMNQNNASWINDMNWDNANQVNANNAGITANNWQNAQDALALNRPDQVGAGGGTVKWTTDANGNPVQTSSLGAGAQGLYDQAQGVQKQMLGGLEGGFGVDNSVMQALRGLQQPGIQRSEDAANARLAAMGLSTGSGKAWNNAQDTLNTTRTNADLQAILGGQKAWLDSQNNMRQNAGLAGNTASSQINDFKNSFMDFAKINPVVQQQQNGFAGVNLPGINMNNVSLPSVSLPGFGVSPVNMGRSISGQVGNLAGQAAGNSWSSGAAGIGDLFRKAYDAWNSQPTNGHTNYPLEEA